MPGIRRSVGVGSVVKQITAALGVRPCSGCEKRARALDRRVILAAMRGKR